MNSDNSGQLRVAAIPSRRRFLQTSVLGAAGAAVYPALAAGRVLPAEPAQAARASTSFELTEVTIRELQEKMRSGEVTAHALAEKYLARIEAMDKRGPAINSVIELNPDALSIADGLDKERKQNKLRGPMHGIPVLIKDNIDTADRMATTAGSLAMLGAKPLKDSFVVQRLRAAGAVILGKHNELIGAHIIGPDATNLITEYSVAMRNELTADEIIGTIHPHPTLSEGLREAVLAAEGRPIHIPPKQPARTR